MQTRAFSVELGGNLGPQRLFNALDCPLYISICIIKPEVEDVRDSLSLIQLCRCPARPEIERNLQSNTAFGAPKAFKMPSQCGSTREPGTSHFVPCTRLRKCLRNVSITSSGRTSIETGQTAPSRRSSWPTGSPPGSPRTLDIQCFSHEWPRALRPCPCGPASHRCSSDHFLR